MDFGKLKTAYLAKRTQFILMDETGRAVESCETLIQLKDIPSSLFEIFPVLETLRSTLDQLTVHDKEIVYPVVEHSQGEQDFIFDFVFKRVEVEGTEFLLWIINDQTDMYMNIMQLRKRIHKQQTAPETTESKVPAAKKPKREVELRVVR